MEGVLAEQSDDLREIKYETKNLSAILVKNTQILDEHQRRSIALEKIVEVNRLSIDLRLAPLEKIYNFFGMSSKVFAGISALAGFVYLVVKLWTHSYISP